MKSICPTTTTITTITSFPPNNQARHVHTDERPDVRPARMCLSSITCPINSSHQSTSTPNKSSTGTKIEQQNMAFSLPSIATPHRSERGVRQPQQHMCRTGLDGAVHRASKRHPCRPRTPIREQPKRPLGPKATTVRMPKLRVLFSRVFM